MAAAASASAAGPLLRRALRGGSYLFLQKLGTFTINALILRRLQLSVTGAVTVQFELALATVFAFRDAFRLAFLRMPAIVDVGGDGDESKILDHPNTVPDKADRPRPHDTEQRRQRHKQRQQQLVNTAWLSTTVSWFLAAGIAVVMLARGDSTQSGHDLEGYTRVLLMYCAAAGIEALVEPMYLLAHSSVLVGWQVSAQGAGFLMRAVVQYVGIFVFGLDGLLSYGLAELAYAASLGGVFMWLFFWKLRANAVDGTPGALQGLGELLPGPVVGVSGEAASAFYEPLTSLLRPLTVQSIVKYLLTEGDKWVLSIFTSLQQMGIYGIVFHLGSLVPRIVFFPLEEATKTIISKLSSDRDELVRARRFILMLLKVMHLIGLVFVAFGVNYAYTLTMLLYGTDKARSGVGAALAMYCLYIPFLGLNGICEAFVHAVGDKDQLMRLNRLMGVFFVIYALSAMLFMWGLGLDTVGIILANCVNMTCRILYCLTFIARYFADRGISRGASVDATSSLRLLIAFWREALPHGLVLGAFAVSFVVAAVSQRMLLFATESLFRHAVHVGIGGICFGVVLATLYLRERQLLGHELRQLRHGPGKSPGTPMVPGKAKDHEE